MPSYASSNGITVESEGSGCTTIISGTTVSTDRSAWITCGGVKRFYRNPLREVDFSNGHPEEGSIQVRDLSEVALAASVGLLAGMIIGVIVSFKAIGRQR